MNILASYDWLKEYVDLKETPEEFAARVSLSGPGVERLYPQGMDLEGVVLGRVKEVKAHPNADKLRIAITDIGSKSPLQIVCGGSNLKADQWVAVAKVGAAVRWHGEGEPVILAPTEIRGVKSEGMICAGNEIGLFDAFPHAEREILDLGAALPELNMKAGAPLADVLGLAGDVVMDIEITTNRPDALGMVGLAREAAAILKRPFTWKESKLPKAGSGKLEVGVADKKLCPRYMGVRIEGVKIGPSPWWMKRRLISAGLRPINAAVDITNFVMLELGQPMHVFDADKLAGGEIRVRKAKAGEKLKALDGNTYDLKNDMLVIADAEKPVAIAGVMGGEETGATSGTTSIVLEAATFDPVSVRRTARALNLHSDAQLRFEKGLSSEGPASAMARAIELILELCGGTVGKVADVRAGTYKPAKFSVSFDQITSLIGVPMKAKESVDTLKRLGFSVTTNSKQLTAGVPWWRDHDIESGRDLVEEIARVYGYANLPAVFPAGKATQPTSRELALESRVRHALIGAGLTETFTYSFTSRDVQELAGYDVTRMLAVQNPLSSDFEFMRTSLLPSLLQVVLQNQDRFRSQELFEIAHAYYHPEGKGWTDLPNERLMLGAAVLDEDEAWRRAKGIAEQTFEALGIRDVTWKRLENDPLWHPGRSVQAWKGNHYLATVGELHPAISARYGFEARVGLCEIALEHAFEEASDAVRYSGIPQFPEAKRDLAVIVKRTVAVQDLLDRAKSASTYLRSIEWFDTYSGKGMDAEKKSVAFHLEFSAPDRTLETEEVETQLNSVFEAWQRAFQAERRA